MQNSSSKKNVTSFSPYFIGDKIKEKFIAVTLDVEAEQCMQNFGIATRYYPINKYSKWKKRYKEPLPQAILSNYQSTDASSFGLHSERFDSILDVKFDILTDILEQTQEAILYLDTDIVFLEKPFTNIIQYFESLTSKKPDLDIILQSDSQSFVDHVNSNLCAGLMFLNYTPLTLALLHRSKELLKENLNDQKAINQAIYEFQLMHLLQMNVFDTHLFPNGYLYFNSMDENHIRETKNISLPPQNSTSRRRTKTPFLVHNNHIVGKEKKIQKLKDSNLWFAHSR